MNRQVARNPREYVVQTRSINTRPSPVDRAHDRLGVAVDDRQQNVRRAGRHPCSQSLRWTEHIMY